MADVAPTPSYLQTNPTLQTYPTSGGAPTTGGGFGSLLTNVVGSVGAANAAATGNENAIGTQAGTLGNIGGIYGPQQTLGNGAFNTIGSTLGLNGQPANYSNFLNMPGYQFAVGQGTQAINRQADAAGNLYTPNTMANIGQYVTGTAMQDYNTYVNQLLLAGGFGASANQGLTGANLTVGGNISQLQANIGQNRAGGISGAAGFLGGANGSGFINNVGSAIGQGYNYLNGGANGSGYSTGTDASGGYTDASGNYISGGSNLSPGNTPGDMNTGYDNSQTDLSQSSGNLGGP